MNPISSRINYYYTKFQTRHIDLRKLIANRNISLISNNCWAAEYYTAMKLPYLTPFVGMYIFSPCYMKLLKRLKWHLSKELSFIDSSQYSEANAHHQTKHYPIGLLGDIELHFIHYQTPDEVRAKWKRRVSRINWDNIFVEHSDRDRFTLEHLKTFEQLKFKKKVCFTSKDYTKKYKSSVWIKDSQNDGKVMTGDKLFTYSKKYFDLVGWFNS